MLFHKESKNIYLVVGLIIAFFIFMFVSGAVSMHHVSKHTSASLQDKRAE